ncbi:MAG: pectin acetylesterase-family hydrolase [Bdellovibrionales bacterium]
MKYGILGLLFLFSLIFNLPEAFADEEPTKREWIKHEIPGATCGKGGNFFVWNNQTGSKKLFISMAGGNACWSRRTCYGFFSFTRMETLEEYDSQKHLYSLDESVSKFGEHDFMYIPYCTGDVHLGIHTANYDGKVANHVGRNNVQAVWDYFQNQGNDFWNQYDEVVLYGASAGAIGALYHIQTLAPYVEKVGNKSLILDSPGLHFGDDFWNKFSQDLTADYSEALSSFGFPMDVQKGNVAGVIPKICEMYPNWNVGVLQASKDGVMSKTFGEISRKNHHKLVHGPTGVLALTEDPHDNCSAYVPSNKDHVFLKDKKKSKRELNGTTPMTYAKQVADGQALENNK